MSQPSADQQGESGRFVVVTQDGMGVAPNHPDGEGVERNPAELVEQPAKVMRIGAMIKQLLEEVRSAPLDDAGRARLAQIHERSLVELLKDEGERILPLPDGDRPRERADPGEDQERSQHAREPSHRASAISFSSAASRRV